ncbi:MAG: autotransporter domain-containing protein [Pseudomonadota bacterium]
MKTPSNNKAKAIPNSLLLTSSVLAMMTSANAQAQTVIPDGNTATIISVADSEIIANPDGNTTTVDGAPAVVIANNDVTLNNDGTLATTGVTQTVQVSDGTSGAIINNGLTGIIEADSRAVQIDGNSATLNNLGAILGTDVQRNGTVYTNITADDFTLNNEGTIDAVVGGAGFSAELSAEGTTININNSGLIAGRGNAGAGAAAAGDGIRFERTRANGMLDGSTSGLLTGDITNSGTITSDGANGTVAGIRFVNGVSFAGTITNEANGVISGVQNGLYFGNATPAGGGDFTGAVVENLGTISSDSRALNIDGTGLTINNRAGGEIIGTGNQRNGTVYADSTAQAFTLNNEGLIDAGAGNEGAGFSVELSAEGNDFTITNSGTIQGRGNAAAGLATAGDGLRFERARVDGSLMNPSIGLFTGTVTNAEGGLIASEGDNGTVAGVRFVNGVSFQGTFYNAGTITGVENGVYFGNPTAAGGGDHTGGVFNNLATGVISSDSRAFNIDGTGLTLNNAGSIIGTGDQRNGTVYADSTAQDFTVDNSGLIDAGEGNQGSGFGAEISAEGNSFTLTNSGTIQGRGNAGAGDSLAGDGIRIGNVGNVGTATVAITNSGTVASEGANGTVAGVRFVNGISFAGTFDNSGTISGVQNGVYFGNPVAGEGADHSNGVFNNLEGGVISSDSRAFNIDGIGLTLNNSGSIIGTGNQRNGTVYADSTAQDFSINNDGVIDAGEGNEGAGFSVELASVEDGGTNFDIVNSGTIQGRGNAGAGAATAGDGLRFERTRVNGMLDGSTNGLFTGTITNSGLIDSEGANGTVAGIRFVNGVSFNGTIENSGTISGVQNGLYFGNATPAGGGDFTGAVVNNSGTISSASRALNIDGTGLVVNNLAGGQIIGTGNQRNGTVYADSTAQNFILNNAGLIDAGEGNEGAGFSAELSAGGNDFAIINSGTIQGRGQAGAGAATAGDGLRFERDRIDGSLMNPSTGLFTGTITNSGTITSESAQGTAAGIRFVNGTSFSGTIENQAGGTIFGEQNGLYFGNATPGGGGDFTGAIVNNAGTISSISRALNIDGTGLTVNNSGSILGTGAQRNGTVYSDATANNFTLNNTGVIDAVVAGSGVSLQLGVNDGDVRSFTLVNDGTIAGRGEALASGASAGLRLFSGAGAGTTVTVADDIVNNGTITSETSAALLIENIAFTGTFTNSGTLSGANAVDASTAFAALNFVQTGGSLEGDFLGSAFTDTLTFADGSSTLAGNVTNDVDVVVDAPTTVMVDGQNIIDGDLTVDGTLGFDLGADSLFVEGDTTLNAGSVVNIATDSIGQADIGSTIVVLDEDSDFVDNGVTVNLDDDDFLIDYLVNIGSIIVTTSAADLAEVSTDANISSFGGALTNAVNANELPDNVFNGLNSVTDAAGFETAALTLLPALNEGVAREIFETQNTADAFVTDRLASGNETGLWGQFLGRTADRDAENTSVTGYDADAFGLTIGVDFAASETLRVGVSYSYADIDIDQNGAGAEQSDISASQISAYLGYNQDKLFVNGLVGYSFSDVDTSRTSFVGPVSGNFDVDGIRAQVNAGYELGTETVSIVPFVGLNYASFSSDNYTETGGLNLDIDARDVDFLEGRIGARLATQSDSGFSVRGNVAYAYDFIGDARVFDLGFAGAGAPFRVASTDGEQSRFEFGAGLNYGQETGFSVGLDYQGELASGYNSHAGVLRLRYAF